ncbi:MAG: 16S rRNA (adenine(1518)-N(6)/adenine(1519)-N(6))-dimethyltransferase RsmA [Thermodesulfobacteriota bacterium]
MTEPYRGRAKKAFGQHFLKDRGILARIVGAAGVAPGDRVLEVGPGPGYLTEELLRAGASVLAVEFDRDICAYLEERFAGESNFELIQSDAMKVDFTVLLSNKTEKLKLVSNPPYNITGPLVAKIIRERAAFSRVVLMLQKEVARRLTAGPGARASGALTIMLWLYYDVKRAFSVSAGSFSPPPDVDSTVVVFEPLSGPRVPVSDEAFFRELVRKAFSTRRKTLSNALKGINIHSGDLASAFDEAGIDPGRRAETLTLGEFSALAAALLGRKCGPSE